MPLYDYRCPGCGVFEAVGGHAETTMRCACGAEATREAVYRQQGVVFKGGGFTKSTLPPASDAHAVQEEWGKVVRKAGWTGERAIEELRKNRVYDKEGRMSVNLGAMPKEARP